MAEAPWGRQQARAPPAAEAAAPGRPRGQGGSPWAVGEPYRLAGRRPGAGRRWRRPPGGRGAPHHPCPLRPPSPASAPPPSPCRHPALPRRRPSDAGLPALPPAPARQTLRAVARQRPRGNVTDARIGTPLRNAAPAVAAPHQTGLNAAPDPPPAGGAQGTAARAGAPASPGAGGPKGNRGVGSEVAPRAVSPAARPPGRVHLPGGERSPSGDLLPLTGGGHAVHESR